MARTEFICFGWGDRRSGRLVRGLGRLRLPYPYHGGRGLGGLEMELMNGSVWNVTGTGRLTKLTIGEGCALKGMLTVNGRTVEAVPGVYEGEIVVMPLTPLSAETSGEAAGRMIPSRRFFMFV